MCSVAPIRTADGTKCCPGPQGEVAQLTGFLSFSFPSPRPPDLDVAAEGRVKQSHHEGAQHEALAESPRFTRGGLDLRSIGEQQRAQKEES